MQDAERLDGILSVSAMHGFAWSDTPDMGAAILVAFRGEDPAAHDQAKRLGRDDSDIRLFALSFTAFFVCFYTFIF